MDVTISIPNEYADRIVDGICFERNYDSNKLTGETKAAFAKRMVIEMVKNCAKAGEIKYVSSTAMAATNEVDDINIT